MLMIFESAESTQILPANRFRAPTRLPYPTAHCLRYANAKPSRTADDKKDYENLDHDLGPLIEVLQRIARLLLPLVILISLHQRASSWPDLAVLTGFYDLDLILVDAGLDVGFVRCGLLELVQSFLVH